jgi:hypothetical protein
MRLLTLLVAIGAVAAPSAGPAAAPEWHLTVEGWGPVRIGMNRADVERALNLKLEGEPLDDEESCIEMKPAGPDRGIWFMFEGFKLTRISVGEPSSVTTPRGIGIGSSANEVRRAYGKGLKAEPHYYEDLPSEYLTYWTLTGKRGVRFETNSKRQVQTIHAGTDSIQYVEGCA